MNKNLFSYDIETSRKQEFMDITGYCNDAIKKSGVIEGSIMVYCPHTTAGITVNENADPDVVVDMINALNRTFPVEGDYKHFEGNSHAHLKSSFVGIEKSFIISGGKMILGTWQSPYFCEFDGPRTRKIYIKIMKDSF